MRKNDVSEHIKISSSSSFNTEGHLSYPFSILARVFTKCLTPPNIHRKLSIFGLIQCHNTVNFHEYESIKTNIERVMSKYPTTRYPENLHQTITHS